MYCLKVLKEKKPKQTQTAHGYSLCVLSVTYSFHNVQKESLKAADTDDLMLIKRAFRVEIAGWWLGE